MSAFRPFPLLYQHTSAWEDTVWSIDRRRRAVHRPRRVPTARRIATLVALGALALGCAEPAGPGTIARPRAREAAADRHAVLNVQLRAMGNPDDPPPSAAWNHPSAATAPPEPDVPPSAARGHLQFKLTEQDDVVVIINWKGQLFNPACERFTGGGLYLADQGELPAPGERAILDLRLGSDVRCQNNLLEGSGPIEAAIARRMMATPEDFVVIVRTDEHPGGAIGGRLGHPGEALSREAAN